MAFVNLFLHFFYLDDTVLMGRGELVGQTRNQQAKACI